MFYLRCSVLAFVLQNTKATWPTQKLNCLGHIQFAAPALLSAKLLLTREIARYFLQDAGSPFETAGVWQCSQAGHVRYFKPCCKNLTSHLQDNKVLRHISASKFCWDVQRNWGHVAVLSRTACAQPKALPYCTIHTVLHEWVEPLCTCSDRCKLE